MVRFVQKSGTAFAWDTLDLGDGTMLGAEEASSAVTARPNDCMCYAWTHTYARGDYDVHYALHGNNVPIPHMNVSAN